MGKTANIIIAGMALCAISCDNASSDKAVPKTVGLLQLSNGTPKPGDSLQIRYQSGPESNKKDLEALYYYMVQDRSYPKDIDFNANMETTIHIPDSATALAFHFKDGDKIDNNKEAGYLLPLYNIEQKPVPGSLASMGKFYLTQSKTYGITTVSKDSALILIGKDLSVNPFLNERWEQTYSWSMMQQNKKEGKKYVQERIVHYKAKDTLSEKDYQSWINLYELINDKLSMDSLTSIAHKEFPKGFLAQQSAYGSFYEERDLDKKKALFENFEANFGEKGKIRDYMLIGLVQQSIDKEDYEAALAYIDRISDPNNVSDTLNNAAWNLVENEKNLDFAEQLSKRSLDLISGNLQHLEEKPPYYSKNQYKNSLESSYRMYADTYALILFKQGKVKEAISFQEKAIGEGGNPEVNDRYIEFLMKDQQYSTVLKTASEFVRNNAATKRTKEALKKAYMQVNLEDREAPAKFAGYLKDLETEGNANALAEIKAKLLEEEAFDFSLKNLKGEEISLASLKGKTVILDFWAIWCGPCKASFPGMQQAVDKFKDNPEVVFLFVNTLEDGPFEYRKERAAEFIADNKYTFNVLIDNPESEENRKFIVAENYDIAGIPTKIIIGPKGKIRYRSVGFNGNNDIMVKELEMLIDILKS